VREKYCWLVAGGWFVLREKYCWLVADKPNEQAARLLHTYMTCMLRVFFLSKEPIELSSSFS
jgi:hypothetical protein